MTIEGAGGSLRRARRSFWTLVLTAVLSSGSLSAGLAAEPSHLTGLRVAVSGLVLVGSVVLAARVIGVVDRARRFSASPERPGFQRKSNLRRR